MIHADLGADECFLLEDGQMIISKPRDADSLGRISSRMAHRPELVRIANGTALVFTATFFGLGLNYAYNIFLARYLGAGSFGLYALGLATFNLLAVISLAGLDSATLKFVPASVATEDERGIRRTVRTLLGLSLAFGCLVGAVLLLGSHTIAIEIFRKPEIARVLWILALGIPAYAASSVLICTLQAFQEVRWRTFVKYISEPVVKVILTLVLLWAGWDLDAALVAFVAALVLSVVLALAPLRRMLSLRPVGVPSSVSIGEVLTYSMPLLWAVLLSSVAVKADVLLLGYWRSAGDVGVYSAAFQTSAIIVLVLQSFESIANPLLSESIARRDRSQLEKLYKILLRWVLTLSFPIFLVIALLPKELLALFGEKFEGGALCLVILAIGQIVNAGTGSANNILLLAGHTRLVMWNTLLAGILQIALNLILIPRYGIVGAAVAAAASLVLVNIVRIVEGFRLLGIQPYEWNVWKPVAAGIGTSVVVVLLKEGLPVRNLFLLVCVVAASYFALLFALGLGEEDIVVLRGVRQRIQRMVGVAQ
jgi:O-antigen/teichoic acid export membrane protein